MPSFIITCAAFPARNAPNAKLYSVEPRSSQCPSRITVSSVFFFRYSAWLCRSSWAASVITAESKGLQLAHCVARELGQDLYAVARKSKKLYMQDGIDVTIKESITTGQIQKMYLSKHDADLIKGKKVGIVDDVLSTGASLSGLEEIVNKAGGIIYKKAFVLAEGDSAYRKDVIFLASIPLL